MPYRDRTQSIDVDFIDHRRVIQDSDGHVRRFRWAAYGVRLPRRALHELEAIDVRVAIKTEP